MQQQPEEEIGSLMGDVEEKLSKVQLLLNEINKKTTENLEEINEIISELVYILRIEATKVESLGFRPSILLDLPDHLRLTVRMLMELGEGTAEDVSKRTGRSRSLESSYLNSLTTMGHVEKERKGQLVYYRINFEKNI